MLLHHFIFFYNVDWITLMTNFYSAYYNKKIHFNLFASNISRLFTFLYNTAWKQINFLWEEKIMWNLYLYEEGSVWGVFRQEVTHSDVIEIPIWSDTWV